MEMQAWYSVIYIMKRKIQVAKNIILAINTYAFVL